MKVVILAGGFGTRLSEETDRKPKPLIEIGGKPIIWHIMKMYEAAGLEDFVVCCGYKSSLIKNYFVNYFTENYDVMVDLQDNRTRFVGSPSEKWRVTLIDTGLDTMTGGRLKRVQNHVGAGTFCLTYGDGVSDVDIARSIEFHKRHGKLATVTAVPSPGRFGVLELTETEAVSAFTEKPVNEAGWINGGFFVLDPGALDYIGGDQTIWEKDPLMSLAADGQLMAYRHMGFWRPMDTLRDKRELERLWEEGAAPWMVR